MEEIIKYVGKVMEGDEFFDIINKLKFIGIRQNIKNKCDNLLYIRENKTNYEIIYQLTNEYEVIVKEIKKVR